MNRSQASVVEYKVAVEWKTWLYRDTVGSPLCDKRDDTVLYTEGYRRGYAENLQQQEKRPHIKSTNTEEQVGSIHKVTGEEHAGCSIHTCLHTVYDTSGSAEVATLQMGGRSHLPQTSPSCSGHQPARWFHSCWSPGPSHPSPSLQECCGPEENKMLFFCFPHSKHAVTRQTR